MKITKVISQGSSLKKWLNDINWWLLLSFFSSNNWKIQNDDNFVTFARFADKNNYFIVIHYSILHTAHYNLHNSLEQTTIKWSLAPIESAYSSGFTLKFKICIFFIKKPGRPQIKRHWESNERSINKLLFRERKR